MKLENYTIGEDADVREALERIDTNCKGFLIVISDANKACGTLTDGDVRRAMIAGIGLDDPIKDCYVTNFMSLQITDDISAAVNLFADVNLGFIPLLEEDGSLANIVTRNAFHALIIQEQAVSLRHDFLSVDETSIFHEYFYRPWGYYKTIAKNKIFHSKILLVKPKATLSLQMHKQRDEHWLIIDGFGTMQLGASVLLVRPGDHHFIPRETRHRVTNDSDSKNLLIVEIQFGEYFEEDDIYRFEDIYGRACIDAEEGQE
jgi:mannose-6-phosphate isomerase-like protein (cupin superfamily)/predicted transcriptional regulator